MPLALLSYFYEILHTNWTWKVQNFPENSEISWNERIPYYCILEDNVQPMYNMLTAFDLCRYVLMATLRLWLGTILDYSPQGS
jgi:hypothetical protein